MEQINETEINMVRGMFEKMANALVDASRAGDELISLRREIDILRNDVDAVRARNRELDAEVIEVRRQRDEAIAERERLQGQASGDAMKIDDLMAELARVRHDLTNAQEVLVQTRRDRDDMGFKHLEAIERAEKAEKLLAAVREAAGCTETVIHDRPSYS